VLKIVTFPLQVGFTGDFVPDCQTDIKDVGKCENLALVQLIHMIIQEFSIFQVLYVFDTMVNENRIV